MSRITILAFHDNLISDSSWFYSQAPKHNLIPLSLMLSLIALTDYLLHCSVQLFSQNIGTVSVSLLISYAFRPGT